MKLKVKGDAVLKKNHYFSIQFPKANAFIKDLYSRLHSIAMKKNVYIYLQISNPWRRYLKKKIF